MKKRLTIAVVAAALAATLTFVAASSVKRDSVTAADALPAYEIAATARSMGLYPISEPVRRGPYYVLQAYDARGVEMRVVADAQLGDILSVAPTQALTYRRGPHIIQVPQADERDDRANDRASIDDRDAPAATNDNADEEPAPPPRRRAAPAPRTTPRWPSHREASPSPPAPPAPPQQQRRSAAPPPNSRRAVLSAPPPSAEGPTPIRPTPRFDAEANPADKFDQPRDARLNAPPPPPGYTPPSALPKAD